MEEDGCFDIVLYFGLQRHLLWSVERLGFAYECFLLA